MKKYICLALMCLMLLLPVQAMAQTEPALKLTVTQDDMIYVTVALEGSVEGISLGVTAEIDHLLLESVPDASQWKVQGLLSDFNDRGQGVWTTDKPKMLEGDMVVLAFRARSAEPFETKVTCTLIVKNGAQEVGRFTAEATVAVKGSAPAPTEVTTPKPTEGKPATKPTEETAAQTDPQAATSVPAATAATTESVAEATVVSSMPTEEPEMSAKPNFWWVWVLAVLAVAAAGVFAYSKKSKK